MNFERKCSVMGRKMKFGCLVKKGVAEVRERDLPEVGPYDVLLHMKVCNICTTDYGQWLGLREHQGYPMAGGHEAAGIVEQVGEKVTDLKVGDMVATGYEGCGHCPACRELPNIPHSHNHSRSESSSDHLKSHPDKKHNS